MNFPRNFTWHMTMPLSKLWSLPYENGSKNKTKKEIWTEKYHFEPWMIAHKHKSYKIGASSLLMDVKLLKGIFYTFDIDMCIAWVLFYSPTITSYIWHFSNETFAISLSFLAYRDLKNFIIRYDETGKMLYREYLWQYS